MYQSNKVGVVVPAFNEEQLLEQTLTGIPEWVDRIVIVDDASTDQTPVIAKEMCQRDSRIRFHRHEIRRGPGRAIISGYGLFHEEGQFDSVAVMAGDNQMDPNDLHQLIRPLCENRADYVKGTRFRHPDLHRVMPRTRFLGNRVLTWLTRYVAGYPELEDAQCGYTAIRGALLGDILENGLVDGYGLPNSILAFLGARNARLEQVPVRPIYGNEKSGLNLRTVLAVYPALLWRAWLAPKPGKEWRPYRIEHETPKRGASPKNRLTIS